MVVTTRIATTDVRRFGEALVREILGQPLYRPMKLVFLSVAIVQQYCYNLSDSAFANAVVVASE